NPHNQNLLIRYSENGSAPIEKEFDMVVLSVGMEISESVKELSRQMEIQLNQHGFCQTTLFDPLQTSRPGIYAAGPFREPKDISESVIEATGTAAKVAEILAPARNTLTIQKEYPPETDVSGQDPRIGVFVCHCGSNIGGYLDVPLVADYAKTLPNVVHAEDNLYTCSQDTIAHITEQVKDLELNRVVVASCSPITHEALFQDAIRQGGLNPYLFEMANIRNQCSWVHSNDWDAATEKAKSLVRMSVAKAAYLEALQISEIDVNNAALIIGGGAAGMTAALNLAEQGFPVHLVERENELGGNLRNLRYFADTLGNGKLVNWEKPRPASQSTNIPVSQSTNFLSTTPQEYLTETITKIEGHPLITVYLNTELVNTDGFKGNFTSILGRDGENYEVKHGVIIIATGGEEYKGNEYKYGQSEQILTQMEFEQLLAGEQGIRDQGIRYQEIRNHETIPDSWSTDALLPDSVVMIQCVGPAEKYCSRICCTTALKNALKLKELNPEAKITIIYRDIRTYGFREHLYTEVRRAGVRFVRYEFENKPKVEISASANEQIHIRVWEPMLGRELELQPDLLVLSTPVVPSKGTQELATRLKLSTDMDGFFLEAHVKLLPVDFAADGVYMAGMAHYPKFLDETIAQAQAAASRAAITLSKDTMMTSAQVAHVDPDKCVGCLTCVRICPYNVPKISVDFSGIGKIGGAAYIEPAVCHGCGSCASECPAKAIELLHYKDVQTMQKLSALFEKVPQEQLIETIPVMEG
ncbi:MAG: FAD-dependent oxidoreductase, partial [Chloroflexota bacterium]|nr:FAD-dependent oxidoreductase [Chloroflexota bacterium]